MGYKLILDMDGIASFGDLYERISSLGDTIYYKECFYIWGNKSTKKKIVDLLNGCEVCSYILKEIDIEKYKDEMNFVSVWIGEHYCAEKQAQFDAEHQDELKKMLENIKNVSNNLQK